MRVNRMVKKLQLVCDPQELFEIGLCLSESPNFRHRIIALKLKEAMEDLHKRDAKKK